MKIIHTGDLHLDSPFSSLDPTAGEKRRGALRAAFSSLVILAKTEGVRLFLICGDLFDDECVTKDTINAIVSDMASFPQCSFVITPGNHDPYSDTSPYRLISFPENVYIFTAENLSFIEIDSLGVRIYGSAYTSQTKVPLTDTVFKAKQDGKINILMHHGDIDIPQSVYSPISTEVLSKSGFDYVALGHIHKGGTVMEAGSTKYAYCGCIEGRDFGETGYKGALIGDIEKGKVNINSVRISNKRYEVVKVDATGQVNFADFIPQILQECSGFSDDTYLRVEITGLTSESFSPDVDILRQFIPSVCYLEIKDKTEPLMNIAKLKEDKSLAGEFYRKLETRLYSADEKERESASLALRYGLRAIYGMEIKA